MKKRLRAVLGTMLAASLSGQAFALGTASYSSELISTRSLGQGGTGVAGVSDDPIATYLNPAALTGLKGTQATFGLQYANGSPTFKQDTAPSAGAQVEGARATSVIVPDFGATTQLLGGKLGAGLAVVTPYGLETHWNGDSSMRYVATDTRLRVVDLTPAVAYKVSDALSVGAGVDYYRALVGQLDKKINNSALNVKLGGGLAAGDANSSLTGTGDGWGYHLGVQVKPNEHHAIGLTYHSMVRVGLDGTVKMTGISGANAQAVFGGQNFSVNARAPLYMPQNLQLGWAWTPNDKTTVELDAAWYDWWSARQLGIVYDSLTPQQNGVLQASNPESFNLRKTINFGIGVNHKCTDAFQGRAGFFYQAAGLPEATFNPAFIDLPRYAGTIGGTYAVTKALDLDFAYDAIFTHTRHVNNGLGSAGALYTQPGGSYDAFLNILSASLTYRTDWRL